MKKESRGFVKSPDYCNKCNKIVFFDDKTMFEDYNRTIIHDSFKCYNFKHYKKLFEKLEENMQTVRTDMKKIQEILF